MICIHNFSMWKEWRNPVSGYLWESRHCKKCNRIQERRVYETITKTFGDIHESFRTS